MTINIKVLGAVLGAALTLGAILVPSAAATNHQFKFPADLVLTGEQETAHVITVNKLQGKCEKAKYAGTVLEGLRDHIALHPELSECTFNGFKMTVKTTGCTFTYDSDTTENKHEGGGVMHAPVWITCAEEKEITYEAGGCVVHVIPQGPLHGARFTVVPEHEGTTALTVATTLTTMTVNSTGGFACSLIGLGSAEKHYTDGTFTGAVILTPYIDVDDLGNHEYAEGSLSEVEFEEETEE